MDEWEKYELHHRKRLAIKPGLTGMWQVSGRSDITDFEEVVELDTKYIAEWCLKLDIEILVKTVMVVFREAIKNNVVGTYKTAYAAMMNGCQRFVLISTDKAVNPTNIMGASKRLCEMVVQSMNMVSHNGHTDWLPRLGGHRKDTLDALHDNEGQAYVSEKPASEAGTGTEFVAVRFGNVLGSNGSVIPLFKRQIEKRMPLPKRSLEHGSMTSSDLGLNVI